MKSSFARSVYRAFVITSAEFADEYNQAMRWLGLVCLVGIMGCEPAPVYGQVAQIHWDVQQDRPVAHDVYVWQGETVDLMPRLVQGTIPLAVTNAPVEFRYREASLPTNVFRTVTASANTNNGVLSVRWRPDYDAGAAWYDYQIIVGSNAANPRCFGRIIMRPTIGFNASTNLPPMVTLFISRGETNGWEVGEHLAWIVNETDQVALEAMATNRVPRLQTYDGLNTLDATGQVTRVTAEDAIWYLVIPDPYASTNEITALRGALTAERFSGTVAGYYCDWGNMDPRQGQQGIVDDGAGNAWAMTQVDYLASGYTNFVFAYGPFGSALVFRVLIPAVTNLDTLVTRGEAENRYAISSHLSEVAFDGLYNSLSDRPVVLASNGIASASHCWGTGLGGWTGWTASNMTLTPSNAVLSGNAGGYLETVGMITGVVNVTQSGVGLNSYSDDGLVTLSYDGGANWYPLASLPAKAIRVGGARLRISMPETPGLPGSTPRWELNSVAVDTWIDSSRASEVFPLHAVSVRADLPSDALDVANKAYVDTVCGLARDTAERALTWWNNPAEGDAYLNGHRLHLGGGWSLIGEPGSFAAISNDGSVGLGVVGDSAQFSVQLANENILVARFDTAMMQIISWSGAASNMWLSVATNGLPANPDSASAWVEYSAALDSGVWSRAPVQATALPTNGASFRISFVNPRWGQTNGYFRVMRQSGNLAALRSMVPLRAPSIMISESNSVAVSTSPGVLTLDSIAQAPAAIDNHAQLYSVLGELWVLDGDGNATRLSTHDGPLWVAKSCNVYTGWGTTVDMISGSRSRFRLTTLRSWDDDQKAVAAAQEDAIRTWKETPPDKRRTPRPHAYVIKPEPSWITEQKSAAVDPNPIPAKK